MVWLLFMYVAGASVADRVVAVVGSEVVLASDAELDREISALETSSSPFWSRPVERRQVDAALLRTAAGDIALYQPSDEAVRERLVALRTAGLEREPWDGLLARWGVDEAELTGILRRRMVVEAYLTRNVEVPPASPEWGAATDALLAQLLPRIRVREIPEGAP